MKQHDLVVIGAGPGGYVAAIRAAQLGLNVGCIEREEALGGTCLRVGCIPSKALLESSERYYEAKENLKSHGVRLGKVELDLATMLKRKNDVVRALTGGVDSLFKKNKIARYKGHGRIVGPGQVVVESHGEAAAEPVEIAARYILIATGSKAANLAGVELDGDRIGTSTEALSYPEVPQHLIVIGAGYIGLELGSVWRRLGAKVTVLEYLDRILPGMDKELADEALKVFQKQGLEFRLSTTVKAGRVEGQECVIECDGAEPVRSD
ncbi:MAG: NAD(P)/FAD-dependent oxidoreductase, partial [Armatimonadota bacterium]|nr:NAD(P)/FAD-dependent oxidoreductase [Armatimonadota bacterium]